MSTGSSEDDRQEPTDVRFGTRSLLLAMVAVAVTLTALSAFLRLFDEDVRGRVVFHWCMFFVLFGGFIAAAAWRRYAAEKHAGRVRFLLAPHSYYFPRMPKIARILAGVGLLVVGPIYWAATSFQARFNYFAVWVQLFNWQTYFAVFVSSVGLAYLWWHRTVRVCDQGFVVRYKMLPWQTVRRWYWDASYADVVVIEFAGNGRVALKVPAGEREALQAFFRRNRATQQTDD
jgi:hypothetical protein